MTISNAERQDRADFKRLVGAELGGDFSCVKQVRYAMRRVQLMMGLSDAKARRCFRLKHDCPCNGACPKGHGGGA